jgi:hypothetical protein
MGKINNVEKAKDDGQSQTQYGIERAINKPHQELGYQPLWGNSEKFKHSGFLNNLLVNQFALGL